MFTSVLKKLFGLRDGEFHISFFMQFYIFLIISALLMVKPTINALFLSNLGADHLPYGYVLVAVVAVITSFFYNKIVKRFSLRNVTIATLFFFAICFWLLALVLYLDTINDWILYAYYLSVAIFGVLVTSQFWLIANMVFNSREAKRLFGFIGAGAIAGGIFGGYLTTLLASSFGNMTVMIVAGGMILGCVPLIQVVWKLRLQRLNSYARTMLKTSQETDFKSPLRSILDSKHLTYLAAIVGVGVLMARMVDFQFSDFANKAIPDSDELASFFGFWFSTFNVFALLIQLFLTNKLLARFGVTTNLLFLPISIGVGCLLFLTFPELWVLVLIKGLDGSLKQSLNKAGIELSILPIPHQIKNQAKSFIDVVVDSIATGLSGLLLIFVIRKLDLNTSYITVIILLVLFIWLVLIYKLRDAYFDSFRENIQKSIERVPNLKKSRALGYSTTKTREVLTLGTDKEVLNLLDRLRDVNIESYAALIVNLLGHKSNRVKEAAIQLLYNLKPGTAQDKVAALVQIEDDKLVYAALDYLLSHTNQNDTTFFNHYLDHKVDYIANAALLCLAQESASNRTLAKNFGLTTRISKKIDELIDLDAAPRKHELGHLLLTIAYAKETQYYSFITTQFNNTEPFVVRQAIKAAGITAHDAFIKNLLPLLGEKHYRKAVQKALKSYGPRISNTIISKLQLEEIPNNIKPHLPKVIESFKNRESIQALMRLVQSNDFVVRYAAVASLLKLQQKFSGLPLDHTKINSATLKEIKFYTNTKKSVALLNKIILDSSTLESVQKSEKDVSLDSAREGLLHILIEQERSGLDCIFKLLSLNYDRNDIEVAQQGLYSDTNEARVNSVEFLDNLLNAQLKTRLLPLLEYQIIDDETDTWEAENLATFTEDQMLKLLLKNRGPVVKKAVLNIMGFLMDSAYFKVVHYYTKHKNVGVAAFAKQVQNRMNATN